MDNPQKKPVAVTENIQAMLANAETEMKRVLTDLHATDSNLGATQERLQQLQQHRAGVINQALTTQAAISAFRMSLGLEPIDNSLSFHPRPQPGGDPTSAPGKDATASSGASENEAASTGGNVVDIKSQTQKGARRGQPAATATKA